MKHNAACESHNSVHNIPVANQQCPKYLQRLVLTYRLGNRVVECGNIEMVETNLCCSPKTLLSNCPSLHPPQETFSTLSVSHVTAILKTGVNKISSQEGSENKRYRVYLGSNVMFRFFSASTCLSSQTREFSLTAISSNYFTCEICSADFQLIATDFSGGIHRWAIRERYQGQEQAEMSRTEDGHLGCFYASLASSVLGSTLLHSLCSQMCVSRCRIPIALHTKSLIPDFLVTMVLSPLSYQSKGWHLFYKICTLWFVTPICSFYHYFLSSKNQYSFPTNFPNSILIIHCNNKTNILRTN